MSTRIRRIIFAVALGGLILFTGWLFDIGAFARAWAGVVVCALLFGCAPVLTEEVKP